jgi:hypothetical protein
MATKVKLELNRKNAEDKVTLAEDIVTAMTGNANFTTPAPTLASITTLAYNVDQKINAIAALESQLQTVRGQLDAAVDLLDAGLTNLGNYVETTANNSATSTNPASAIIESAGMEVAGAPTPVGPMPKVTGLSGTAGDEDGEVDLLWNPVKRGLAAYVVQMTSDPAASTGWTNITHATPKKSKGSFTGLPSATKQWFRVAALGTAGQGPYSDPVQVTVP